jgi:cytochrome P450
MLMMTRDKKVHAARRKLSSAKMSKANVGDLHDLVASKVSMLMETWSDMTREHKPVNVFAAWRSMTLDIISTFAFGHSLNALDRNGLDHEMLETLESALAAFYMVSCCFASHLAVC